MHEDKPLADGGTGGAVSPDLGTADRPVDEIRLSPARVIGLRATALGGLAVGAIAAAAPLLQGFHTTSGP